MSLCNIACGTRRWRLVHIYADKSHFIICSGRQKSVRLFSPERNDGRGGVDVNRVDERKGVNVSRPAAKRVYHDRPIGLARVGVIYLRNVN